MTVDIGVDFIGIYEKTPGWKKLGLEYQPKSIKAKRFMDDGPKEVVGWHRDEWIEDPETVVPAIVNAIKLAYTDPKKLRELLKVS